MPHAQTPPSRPCLVDLSRRYTTRAGDIVVLHAYVARNSLGEVVTFPVKGNVIHPGNPRRNRMQIWTAEGRSGVFGPEADDLMDFPPVLRGPVRICADCDATGFSAPCNG